MNLKKYFLVTIYSIIFIPVYGLLMLDNSTKSDVSIFICLIYTFTSAYFVLNEFKNLRAIKFLIVLFPSLYLTLSIFVKDINIHFLLNPIFIANIFLYASIFIFKELNLKKVYFFYVFFAYFYAFILFKYWENTTIINDTFQDSVEKKYINENINLQDYNFTNHKNDTIKVKSQKLVLVETWNENCPPCIKSINDLESFIDSLKNDLEHYYLYESSHYREKNNFSEVIDFKYIEQKNKILIDFDQSFFKTAGMNSYPVFLLFDKEGKLLDYFSGYSSDKKDYFKNRIENMIKTATNNGYK